jgi:hypothetical protein
MQHRVELTKIATVAREIEQKGVSYSHQDATKMIDSGMEIVLREIAWRELRLYRQHEGPAYIKSEQKASMVEEAFQRFAEQLPGELIGGFSDFYDEAKGLECDSLDAGFVAGFVAGYRFLKELYPE